MTYARHRQQSSVLGRNCYVSYTEIGVTEMIGASSSRPPLLVSRSISTLQPKQPTNAPRSIHKSEHIEVNHKANRSKMLSRSASLLSKRAGHSISTAVSKQLAPTIAAKSSGSPWTSPLANVSLSSNQRQYTTHSQLPEEHQMIYDMCRNFANEELAPNAGKWDQKHAFPTEAITHMVRYRT